jgi:hypothetical protein
MENILQQLDPQNILRDLGSTDFLNLLEDGSDLSGGPEDLPTDEDEEVLLELELVNAEGLLPIPDTADEGGDEASGDETAVVSLIPTQIDHLSEESSGENGLPDFRLINESLHSDAKDTSEDEREVDLPSSSRVGKRALSAISTDEGEPGLRIEKITSGKPLRTHYSLLGNPGITITRVYKSRTLEKTELGSEITEYENSYDSRSTSTSERKLRTRVRDQRQRMRMEEEALKRSASPYSPVPVLESQDQKELVVLKNELNEVVERMMQLKNGLLTKYGVCSATYQIKIETRTRTARIARKRQTSD